MQPEMSNNVQKYDKKVYLRVSEAQRCRVHSALMVSNEHAFAWLPWLSHRDYVLNNPGLLHVWMQMPVFDKDCADKPLAVFELVQSDKEVVFPALIAWLRQCLEVGWRVNACSHCGTLLQVYLIA